MNDWPETRAAFGRLSDSWRGLIEAIRQRQKSVRELKAARLMMRACRMDPDALNVHSERVIEMTLDTLQKRGLLVIEDGRMPRTASAVGTEPLSGGVVDPNPEQELREKVEIADEWLTLVEGLPLECAGSILRWAPICQTEIDAIRAIISALQSKDGG